MKLQAFLREAHGRYHERAERLARVTESLGARPVAAFVLFTPRQPYERAIRAWQTWRRTGAYTGTMPNLRREYIEGLAQHGCLERGIGESSGAWSKRLAAVRGLGIVKVPFLQCLLEPLSPDVDVCIDVWMARHYLRREKFTLWDWSAVQGVHGMTAISLGWKPFPLQWAIWDYVRTAGANGRTLFVRETDIGADLTAG